MDVSPPTALRRTDDGRKSDRASGLLRCLVLAALALVGCSEDARSPLQPSEASPFSADRTAPPISPGDPYRGDEAARVVGALIGVSHSWPIVNRVTIRDLNATLGDDDTPHGSFTLEMELDFGAGAFLQRTTEEVLCLEIAEREDGSTDIWISSAAEGWATVPPGVTHYAITHIRDAPGGDLQTGRSILPVDGDPVQFCRTRPDLSASDPTGLGPVELMAAEAGNVVSIDRR